MRLNPAHLLVCLAVWAWQTDHWLGAIIIALLLGFARLGMMTTGSSRPWQPRICMLASGLGAAGVFLLTPGGGLPALAILEWLPALGAPWMFWQYRDYPDGIPARVWGGSERPPLYLDLAFALGCLLAASLGNRHPLGFGLVVVAMAGWSFWSHRPTGRSPTSFAVVLLLGAVLGLGFHQLLVSGQSLVEAQLLTWISRWWQPPYRDPSRQATALGQLGRLKLDSRIVIRLGPQAPAGNHLLMQASYTTLVDTTWFARQSRFQMLSRDGVLGWSVPGGDGAERWFSVEQSHGDDRTLLALPAGVGRVRELAAEQLLANQYGALQAVGVPDPVHFQVGVGGQFFSAGPPVPEDRQIPVDINKALDQVVSEADLSGLPAARVPQALEDYFARHFSYSLTLEGGGDNPLEHFLLSRRRGHCEYFATATVLLLRRLGIPARYATGFSVQEFSFLEGRMIARERHAHAWALAYIDGRWWTVDTTPPDWESLEAAMAPWWSRLMDLWQWLVWQIRHRPQLNLDQTVGGGLILTLILAWGGLRWRRRRRPKAIRQSQSVHPPQGAGVDSECYMIVDWCRRRGMERPQGQTLASWLPLAAGGRGGSRDFLLEEILALHYRYRFDPNGLSQGERQRLGACVAAWLAQQPEVPISSVTSCET